MQTELDPPINSRDQAAAAWHRESAALWVAGACVIVTIIRLALPDLGFGTEEARSTPAIILTCAGALALLAGTWSSAAAYAGASSIALGSIWMLWHLVHVAQSVQLLPTLLAILTTLFAAVVAVNRDKEISQQRALFATVNVSYVAAASAIVATGFVLLVPRPLTCGEFPSASASDQVQAMEDAGVSSTSIDVLAMIGVCEFVPDSTRISDVIDQLGS